MRYASEIRNQSNCVWQCDPGYAATRRPWALLFNAFGISGNAKHCSTIIGKLTNRTKEMKR